MKKIETFTARLREESEGRAWETEEFIAVLTQAREQRVSISSLGRMAVTNTQVGKVSRPVTIAGSCFWCCFFFCGSIFSLCPGFGSWFVYVPERR